MVYLKYIDDERFLLAIIAFPFPEQALLCEHLL